MEFGIVPHQQIEASSETQNNTKNFGRLNNAGWCAIVEPVILGKVQYHYFRVDLLNPHFVCSVASQGIRTSFTDREPEGVTSYYLKYSLTGVEWLRYHKVCTLVLYVFKTWGYELAGNGWLIYRLYSTLYFSVT